MTDDELIKQMEAVHGSGGPRGDDMGEILRLVREHDAAREGIEPCEGCGKDIDIADPDGHQNGRCDAEGIWFCSKCWGELEAEAIPDPTRCPTCNGLLLPEGPQYCVNGCEEGAVKR